MREVRNGKYYYSVTDYNKAIKNFIDNKKECQEVRIIGEISNFKRHPSGLFFSIKDDNSSIKVNMFSYLTNTLKFEPKDGDKVLIEGSISVYVARGEYSIVAKSIELDGEGDLLRKFEELKKKLEQEGLFLEIHKKKIPKYPKRIGIITADTGAAIHDIISTINRRYPIVETLLFPSLVQGDRAKEDLVKNLKEANKEEYNLDVIIFGRGGGSIEDLWPFNEEIVAREIYNSRVPIISGVGHEPDITISDYVADLRAPTPTGAAEMVCPDKKDILKIIEKLNEKCIISLESKINLYKDKLFNLTNRKLFKNPLDLYEAKIMKFDNILETLNIRMKNLIEKNNIKLNNNIKSLLIVMPHYIKNKENNYNNILSKLETLNPITTIKRGYTITKYKGKSINTIKGLEKGNTLNIELTDGIIDCNIENINIKEN